MSRLEQLRRYLTEETIDAFLVTGSKNIRYLANFTGSFGALVITKDQSFIISDFRYITQAKEQAAGFEFYQATQGLIPAIALLVKELNIQSLAIETHQMTAETYLQLNEQVTAELIESPKVIETIRQEEIGIDNFSIDLMFANPGQNWQVLKADLETVSLLALSITSPIILLCIKKIPPFTVG